MIRLISAAPLVLMPAPAAIPVPAATEPETPRRLNAWGTFSLPLFSILLDPLIHNLRNTAIQQNRARSADQFLPEQEESLEKIEYLNNSGATVLGVIQTMATIEFIRDVDEDWAAHTMAVSSTLWGALRLGPLGKKENIYGIFPIVSALVGESLRLDAHYQSEVPGTLAMTATSLTGIGLSLADNPSHNDRQVGLALAIPALSFLATRADDRVAWPALALEAGLAAYLLQDGDSYGGGISLGSAALFAILRVWTKGEF